MTSIKKRKVVQIAIAHNGTLTLCDDGTMFTSFAGSKGWVKVLNVPQPKRRKKK